MADKGNRVNETLKLPLEAEFTRDMDEALQAADGVGAVVLAFIDVDHFLQVNESFGRDVGDRVLIETGEYIRAALPADARLYRYGGDQFAVIFGAEFEKEDALLLLEGVRRDYGVKLPDNTSPTVSVGISAAFEDGDRTAELVRKAEGAMFRGKYMGRNRVCLAREEKMVTKTSHYTADQLKRLTKVSKREGIGEAILLREALDALLRKYDA